MRGVSEPGGNSNDRDLKGSCNFAGKVAMPCPKPRREDWQAWVIHFSCLQPQSSLGGEGREHSRPVCAQNGKELLCCAAFDTFMCHLQRQKERTVYLYQLFLSRHEDTFSPNPLSSVSLPGIRSYSP